MRSNNVKELDVFGSKDTFFLDNNDLFVIERSQPRINMQVTRNTLNQEIALCATTDIKAYKTTLTENEKNELSNSETITPLSGPLTSTKQEQNLMGNIRATLTVTYGRPVYGGYQTLHLCKATGTYQNLMPPPNEGVSAQTSTLAYYATGKRFINGVQETNTTIGYTKNYSSPTFSNVQLMPENVSMYLYEGANVDYTLYCTRGVTIEVYMPFN